MARLAVVSALALGGCASGVDDDAFASFTGAPQMTTSATAPTGAGDDDNDSQITADAVGTVGSTAGGTDNPTSGSGPTSGSTTGVDPDSSGGDDCNPPCGASEVCIAGNCLPDNMGGSSSGGMMGCNQVAGSYADCLGPGDVVDTSGCGAAGSTCITGGMPVVGGSCSVTSCNDACDCPAAPATGNAPVECDAITSDPTATFCFLDCGAGQTCPDGMECFGNLACVWPSEQSGGVPYGNCFDGGESCGISGLCLNDGAAMTIGVCTQACNAVGDCPPAPGGTAPVQCTDLTNDGAPECSLNCSAGQSCPAGMTCFQAAICAWN